jgi:large repetitive protein
MTARRDVRRTVAVILAALGLPLLLAANAAAQPVLSIVQPHTGEALATATPLFAGATDDQLDAVTLEIYAGADTSGTRVQSVEALPAPLEETWQATPSPPLADGTYTAVARQTNFLLEEGESNLVTFTVDTTPPLVSVDPPTTPTADSTPTLTGSLGQAAGDVQEVTVEILGEHGETVAEGSALVSGATWSYTAPALGDGAYTARARQLDSAGNLGESEAAPFTIDTTPPLVTLGALATPTNDPTPTLTGGAGGAVGDLQTVLVRVYHGSKPEGSVAAEHSVTPSLGAWSYTTPTLADGTYTARAYQADAAGNEGHSAPDTFVVDTVAPSVSISVSPEHSGIVQVTRPTFSGAGGQASGDGAKVRLKIFEGAATGGPPSQSLELPVVAGKWTSESSGPQLGNGSYTAVVEQSDSAGNTATAATAFVVATGSPTVTLSPAGLVHRGEAPFLGPTPSFSGEGGSEPEDATSVTLNIYAGTSASGSPMRTLAAPLSGSKWAAGPVSALPDGTYTAQAEQHDESLQPGVSQAVTFTVDADPPQVTLSAPTDGSSTTESSVRVSGAAGTAEGDSSTVTVRLYEGSSIGGQSPLETVSVGVGPSGWATTFGGLNPGTYTASAQQHDDVGNVGTSAPTTFTVKAPSVTILAAGLVHRGERSLSGPTPSFSGAAGSGGSITVTVYSGETASGSSVRVLPGSLSGSVWSTVPAAALADGVYTAEAVETYEGQTSESEPLTFTVDADPPRVTLSAPTDGSSTTESSVHVSGAAGTAEGDSSTVTVRLYEGSSIGVQAPLETVSVTASAGVWSTTFGGLGPGTYTVSAQQQDDVGNLGSSAPATFTVLGPPAPAPPPPEPSPPSPPTAAFQWFPAAPLVGEPVSLVSTSTDPASPLTGFAWSLAASGPLSPGGSVLNTTFATPGSHVVRLSVTDAAGRSGSVTETIPVAARSITLMQPFPVVRIAGSEGARGVSISLFTVQAPTGARVTVSCRGRGCPAKPQSVLAAAGRGRRNAGTVLIFFKRFERALRVGAVLEIRVWRAGQIGKYTRFVVRRGKLPARQDTCLSPAGVKPMTCPS